MQEVDSACKRLLHSCVELLGFDMEWRIMYTTGVQVTSLLLFRAVYPSCQVHEGCTDIASSLVMSVMGVQV